MLLSRVGVQISKAKTPDWKEDLNSEIADWNIGAGDGAMIWSRVTLWYFNIRESLLK
jgi:hypothetical protein